MEEGRCASPAGSMKDVPYLPDAVVQRILELVETDDLLACRKVCKAWREISQQLGQKLKIDLESLSISSEQGVQGEQVEEDDEHVDARGVRLTALLRNTPWLTSCALYSSSKQPALNHLYKEFFPSGLVHFAKRSLRHLSLGEQVIGGRSNRPVLSISLESLALLSKLQKLETLVVGPLSIIDEQDSSEVDSQSGADDSDLDEEDFVFPKLKRLGILHTNFSMDVMALALDAMLKQAPLLTELKLERFSFGRAGLKVSSPQLKSLRFSEAFLAVDCGENDEKSTAEPALRIDCPNLVSLTGLKAKCIIFDPKHSPLLENVVFTNVQTFIPPRIAKLDSIAVEHFLYRQDVLNEFRPFLGNVLSLSRHVTHVTLNLQTSDKSYANAMNKGLRDWLLPKLRKLDKLEHLRMSERTLMLLSNSIEPESPKQPQPILFPRLRALEVELSADNPTHWYCLDTLFPWVEQNPSVRAVTLVNPVKDSGSVTGGPPRATAEHLEALARAVLERFQGREIEVTVMAGDQNEVKSKSDFSHVSVLLLEPLGSPALPQQGLLVYCLPDRCKSGKGRVEKRVLRISPE
jgi:hypothetical protein